MGKGVITSADLDRGDVLTGAAKIQQLRENERDRIHLERAAKAAIEAEFKMKKEKKAKKKKKVKGLQDDPEC